MKEYNRYMGAVDFNDQMCRLDSATDTSDMCESTASESRGRFSMRPSLIRKFRTNERKTLPAIRCRSHPNHGGPRQPHCAPCTMTNPIHSTTPHAPSTGMSAWRSLIARWTNGKTGRTSLEYSRNSTIGPRICN